MTTKQTAELLREVREAIAADEETIDSCPSCEWCNTGLLNYSTVTNGPSLWLCHGCAARKIEALEAELAEAKHRLSMPPTDEQIRDALDRAATRIASLEADLARATEERNQALADVAAARRACEVRMEAQATLQRELDEANGSLDAERRAHAVTRASFEQAYPAVDRLSEVKRERDAALAEVERLRFRAESAEHNIAEFKRAAAEQLAYDMQAVLTGTPESRAREDRDTLKRERDAARVHVQRLLDGAGRCITEPPCGNCYWCNAKHWLDAARKEAGL